MRPPAAADRGLGQVSPGQVPEQPPVGRRAERGLQDRPQRRRPRHRANLTFPRCLSCRRSRCSPAVRPGRAGDRRGLRQQQFAPTHVGEVQIRLAQHGRLLWPESRVVHDGEQRDRHRTGRPARLPIDPLRLHFGQQTLRLLRVDDHTLIDRPHALRGRPLHRGKSICGPSGSARRRRTRRRVARLRLPDPGFDLPDWAVLGSKVIDCQFAQTLEDIDSSLDEAFDGGTKWAQGTKISDGVAKLGPRPRWLDDPGYDFPGNRGRRPAFRRVRARSRRRARRPGALIRGCRGCAPSRARPLASARPRRVACGPTRSCLR